MNDSHSKFADLLNSSEDSLSSLLSMFKETLIFIFDSQGRFTFGTTDSKSRLHADPDTFLGKSVEEIMPEHVAAPLRVALGKNQNGQVAEFDYWMDMITHVGWFSATCSPIFREGKFEGSMAIVKDVTKEKTALDALRASEENYRTLVEAAAMGIVIVADGIVVYSNPLTSEISGFTPEELMGHNFLDFIAPSERERVFKIHTDRMKGEDSPEVYELKMLIKSGKLVDIEINTKVISYQGKPAVQVLMQDITSRKQTEKELLNAKKTLQDKVAVRTRELERYREHLEDIVQERTSRLRDTINLLRTEIEERILAEERIEHLNLILKAIRNINLLITNETDIQKLINGACKDLVETRGYINAWIFLTDIDGESKTAFDSGTGKDLAPLMNRLISGEETPCLIRTMKANQAWISDTSRTVCSKCTNKTEEKEPGRVMACRLECHNRIYGVLTVSIQGEYSPDDEEISLFKEVCNDIAFAIDSIEHEKDRKISAKALIESQKRYQSLFENTTAAILILDGDTILECNTKCAEVFKCTIEELEGNTPYAISPEFQPDGRSSKEAASEYINSAVNHGQQYFHWTHKRMNGEVFPAEVSLKAIEFEGKTFVQAALSDVTTRTQTEEALKESEHNYRTLYTNVPIGLFRCEASENGIFHQVNPAMASMFGFSSPDKLLQRKTETLFAQSKDIPLFRQKLEEEGILRDFTVKMKRADGTEFWASISSRFSRADNSDIGMIDGIITDISDTMAFENDLKQSVEKLERAIDGTVSAMSLLVELKDPYTSGHQKGVAHLACAIATEMELEQSRIDCIRIAAKLHDLGKLSIPTEILSKPGTLSEYEIDYLKTHPQTGYDILKSIEFPWPIAKVILQHHERLNGSGYPAGLKKEEIMLEACIIAVADVVEATASRRPYRASRGIEVALDVIEEGSGTIFHPGVVKACIRLFREKSFKLLDHDKQLIGADFAI